MENESANKHDKPFSKKTVELIIKEAQSRYFELLCWHRKKLRSRLVMRDLLILPLYSTWFWDASPPIGSIIEPSPPNG